MIELNSWIKIFLQALHDTFPNRIWFVGLQGSYARGEATETSDIDVVLILDELTAPDIEAYNAMLDTLPCRELMCGFLSGKKEIANWEPSDLFQLFYDTKPIEGSMEDLLPLLDEEAVNKAIKIGVCNVYHGTVHNMLYSKSEKALRGLYKNASFILQAICFKQTGRYISRQKELMTFLASDEQAIADTFLSLKNGGTVHFQEMSEALFNWTKKWIGEVK